MMEPERHRIFIYGTLRRNGSNAYRMEGSRFLGPATVRGRLYRISWYPGLILDPAAGEIIGEIHEVNPGQLSTLDAYEGGEYQRVPTKARLTDGRTLSVQIWEFIASANEANRIFSGDWFDAATA